MLVLFQKIETLTAKYTFSEMVDKITPRQGEILITNVVKNNMDKRLL